VAASLVKASSFKAITINSLFDKLSAVIDRHAFQASDIYNFGETGVTLVQRPSKGHSIKRRSVDRCTYNRPIR